MQCTACSDCKVTTVLSCPVLSCPVPLEFPYDRCVVPPTMCIVPCLNGQSRGEGGGWRRSNGFPTFFLDNLGNMPLLVWEREEMNTKSVINDEDG